MAVILSGKQQNGDTTRAYSVSCSSRTPDANMRSPDPYGDTLLINSCDLSRAYYVITIIMASNTELTTVRDRELVKFIIVVSLKTKFKRHMPGEFHDFSWVFWSRHCSRKGARRVEERRKKKKTKMTKVDFHRSQVRHFSNNFEQCPCYCKMGQRQIADLSVFGRIKYITRRNISV